MEQIKSHKEIQGFAHQLFVVFAKGHPDIVISPINMNEDVTKMYRHVTGN